MKYIKLFENNTYKNYKKYIICDDVRRDNTITVYKVGKDLGGRDSISLKSIFSYFDGNLEVGTLIDYYGNSVDTLKIYDQSDDPDYLIDMLPYIADKNTFNL